MKKIITGILITMLSIWASQAVYAKPVGKFIKVEGRVDITRQNKPAEQVTAGDEVFEKDIIRSKSDSKAEILFTDGNVLRLAQKTRVEISEYIVDSSSNKRSAILNLFRGKIQNKVKKLLGSIFGEGGSRYEVHTKTSVCGVRGTNFFMNYQKGVSSATFKEGFGYGYNKNAPNNVIEVQAGQSMIVPDAYRPPVVRDVSQAEINQLEEETTPKKEEKEKVDEEKSSGEMNNSGKKDEKAGKEESSNSDEKKVAEDNDTKETKKETANSETANEDTEKSDTKTSDESVAAANEGATAGGETESVKSSEPEAGIADEGTAAVEETGSSESSASEQAAAESSPAETGGLREDVATTDSASQSGTTNEAVPVSDSGFVTSDSSMVSGTVSDVGGVGGGILDESYTPDPLPAGDQPENIQPSTNNPVTIAQNDPGPIVTVDPPAIPQEPQTDPDGNICSETNPCDNSSSTSTTSTDTPLPDIPPTDITQTDTTPTDPTPTDPTPTDSTPTDPTPTNPTTPQPAPIMTVSGKLMGIAFGTNYQGEYILPRTQDPFRQGNMGRTEQATYRYEYFLKDDGVTYLRGLTELETSDPDTYTRNEYLPGGTLLTETGGKDVSMPQITNTTWVTMPDITIPPGTGYVLRYTPAPYDATIMTGIGSFTGDIMGISSELWSAAASAPSAITFSGQYTSPGDPVTMFKSPLSGSFTDGGTYSGIFSGDEAGARGFIYALYINPDETELGILKGDFSGTVDTANGWSGTMYPATISTNTGTVTNANFLTSLGNGDLEVERLAGSFSGSSGVDIKAYGFGNTSYLKGYDWGIFDMAFGYATYDENAASSAWSGSFGGHGVFGEKDGGIWEADISNGEWLSDKVSGDISGTFLTMTKKGTIEGQLIGPGGSAGNWAAVSQGTWTKSDDLQFSSGFGGGVYLLTSEENGNYSNAADPSAYSYHYDLYSHEGGYQYYDSVNGTDTYVQVNAWDFDGTTAYFVREKYVYDHNSMGLISYTPTQETGTTLQDLADPSKDYPGLTFDFYDQWTSHNMFNTGNIEGILGGLDSPWAATSGSQAGITVLGLYQVPFYIASDQPIIFANGIDSTNPYDGTATTFDGGAYTGFMGGIIDPSVNGNIYAIYIDPNNNAGVLLGKFQGHADITSGIWDADGGIYPVQLSSTLGVAPDALLSKVIYTEYHPWDNFDPANTSAPEDGSFFDSSGGITGSIDLGGGHYFSKNIDGQPWGVWQAVLGGVYTGTPGGDWMLALHNEMYDQSNNISGMIAKYGVSGGTWLNNKIDADVLGAWVDLKDVVVGLSSGKIAGTYDPTNSSEMTWQTLGAGAWVKAGQFLDTAATPEGRAALAQLNIPAYEIGKTTLNGTGIGINDPNSSISVTMTDVTFFSSSTGGAPRIWATNNVSGNYTGNPIGAFVSLTDSNTAYGEFIVKKWDSNTWVADVSNSSMTLNRTDVTGTVNVQFNGVAGGSYTGTTSGTFSGEGAGVAK